jgi:hypothetical protein
MASSYNNINNIDQVNNLVDGYHSAIEHGLVGVGRKAEAAIVGKAFVPATIAIESAEVAAGFQKSPTEGIIQSRYGDSAFN